MAVAVSLAIASYIEAGVILAVIILNVVIGFTQYVSLSLTSPPLLEGILRQLLCRF